ncbi:TIGR02680 family protein [Enterococcus mundtii]|uniref:TIGR02680 family protein n=1 Tax=Enterococcus mundtii TaxID=53346 RepID=UPI00189AB178|nr:TIGR02680 family protein [Enterococcus mundtii]MBO1084942.1 TIGR02680 family protein [Enterococcus mundtii]MDV7743802.1 TIGR02680 family protein [Enterococcus mundtii]
MANERWHLHRACIVNYWYFDEAYFEFSQGKLLLRGANGSGKSVTTASLLPLLLDGKTNPSRLDPFGSTSRKIEEYLLGEKDIARHDDRTGYLVLEYKFGEHDIYFTSGLGIRARRGKSLDRWYFILPENQRVGIDFPLWHDLGGNERRPYSEKELAGRLATGGRLTRKQAEYAEWINNYLFSFESMETFNQMIQLQLDIRKPKLSKDFAPTEIYRILEEALPQLKDEDLHEVSDSLENIETAKNQLDQAQQDLLELTELADVFEIYHRQVRGKYANYTLMMKKKEDEASRLFQKKSQQFLTSQQRLKEYEEQRNILANEIKIVTDKIQKLQHHDIFRLEKEQHQFLEEVQRKQKRIKRITEAMESDKTRHQKYQEELDRYELNLATFNKEQQKYLVELAEHVEGTGFMEHPQLVEDFNFSGYQMNMDYWKRQLREYREAFARILEEVRHLNQVKQQQVMIEKKLSELAKDYDRINYDLTHYQEMFQSELTKTEIALGQWQKSLPFSFSDADWQLMLHRLNTLFTETTTYEQVKEPLVNTHQQYELGQHRLIQEKSVMKQQVEKQLEDLQEELMNWRQRKLPEPQRRMAQVDDRKRLLVENKKFVSFYEIIDFFDEVPQIERNQIEAALLNSGMLDALVCEERLALENEQQLIPNPQMLVPTLADYLQPRVGGTDISEGYAIDLLQSIVLDTGDQTASAVNSDGSYNLGIYRGKTTNSPKSQYIGKESQKRFLKEKITEVEELISIKEIEIIEYSDFIQEIERNLEQTNQRFNEMPDDSELQDIQRDIREQQQLVYDNQQVAVRHQEMSNELNQQYKTIYLTIQTFQEKHEFIFSETFEEMERIRQQLSDYAATFDDLYEAFTKGRSLPDQINRQKEYLHDIQSRQLEAEEEMQEVSQQLTTLNYQLQTLAEQLAVEGIKEIRQEVKRSLSLQQKKEQELRNLNNDKIPYETSQIALLEKDVSENHMRRDFYQILYECWLETGKRENRRYQQEEQSLNEIVKHYRGEEELRKAATNLKRVQREKMVSLGQYSPELVECESTDFPESIHEWTDSLLSEAQLLQADSSNDLLYLIDEQNRRTSVQAICQQLSASIEEQEVFVDQEDHRLFEEILLNSIGNNIKGLISKTEQWVKKMNQILQNTKDENRLRLSIRWVAKIAESEQEMNTKDLVRILRQPSAMLTSEDLERMIRHFREKINYAKILRDKDEEEAGQSLHEVMKDVLDYRHWFKFLLEYQKDNEPKRELTNPRFYKLSGGEKAVAMYLPLFTAMYARFEDAKAEAPRIVCLDEAFAGVDELNIADLFGTLEDLGFDYLLNSQALWGDYDTVSSLNVYQLLRKANSTTVGMVRSHWNGKWQEMLGD